MLDKDPFDYSVVTYAGVILLAAWGGITNFLRRHKAGHVSPISFLTEMVGEMCVSGFVGVITFWGAQASGFSGLWTAVLVGIAGHMGTRALYLMELAIKERFFPEHKEPAP